MLVVQRARAGRRGAATPREREPRAPRGGGAASLALLGLPGRACTLGRGLALDAVAPELVVGGQAPQAAEGMRRPAQELRERVGEGTWLRLGASMSACLAPLARILADEEGVEDPDFAACAGFTTRLTGGGTAGGPPPPQPVPEG